ncbi:DUF6192 family protein [Streptomyces sp. NPDC005374]|uniref:DUF6192 family protein n=1 Tax=Streptomyces sp. NPDC005374 TaxID=3364713 RepID=UPI0036957CFB
MLASVKDEAERWAAIEDPPFNQRTGQRRWTPDSAKRLVGQRVEHPVTVEEKVQAVTDLVRDDDVAGQVATGLLRRPAVSSHHPHDQATDPEEASPRRGEEADAHRLI